MRWVIIGASDISATRMVPALRAAGQDVRRIYSSTLERAERYSIQHEIATAVADLGTAFDDIDAAYISSTNDRHAEQVIAAAEAGRHVLCEKPLATTAEDALSAVAACRGNNVVLAVDHHLRSSAPLRELSRQIKAGAIGKILSARLQNAIMLAERLRTWRVTQPQAGAGVIFDLAVHDIDAMRFVLGRDLVEVTALSASQCLGADNVEDVVVSAQRYQTDIMVAAHEAYTVPFARTAIEIHGSEGALSALDMLRPDSRGEIWLSDWRGKHEIHFPRSEGVYVQVVLDFCRAVREGTEPAATGIDGLKAVLGVLALRRSAATGERVTVKCPAVLVQWLSGYPAVLLN